ncbi:urokinase plasminogen activator surface receptor-like isoform X2 [Denticeps clupeoides]|nr:urokinase plasminogen activator surface receptor-like isoform X2 [Denticeps clupeoides]
MIAIDGSQKSSVHTQDCETPNQCQNSSFNFGTSKIVLTTKCCTTDLCNSGSFTASLNDTQNGRKCFSCSATDCNSTVNCVGNEDRCIKAIVDSGGLKKMMKGCVTKNSCLGDFLTNMGYADVRCCKGNLCNGASGVVQSILLLAISFISYIFH